MAVIASVFGEILVMVLKMLISTRNSVTRSAIQPGTTSGGMRKLTQDTTTKKSAWQVVDIQISEN